GPHAELAPVLLPGATVSVDAAVSAGPGALNAKGIIGPVPMQVQNASTSLAGMAASLGASRPGELALVGSTDPLGTLRVGGARPNRTSRAVLVEQVSLESADAVRPVQAATRVVLSSA